MLHRGQGGFFCFVFVVLPSSMVRAAGYVSNADGIWLKLASPGLWGEADAFLFCSTVPDRRGREDGLARAQQGCGALSRAGTAAAHCRIGAFFGQQHRGEQNGAGAARWVRIGRRPNHGAVLGRGHGTDAGKNNLFCRQKKNKKKHTFFRPDTSTIKVGILQQNQEVSVVTERSNHEGTWCLLKGVPELDLRRKPQAPGGMSPEIPAWCRVPPRRAP